MQAASLTLYSMEFVPHCRRGDSWGKLKKGLIGVQAPTGLPNQPAYAAAGIRPQLLHNSICVPDRNCCCVWVGCAVLHAWPTFAAGHAMGPALTPTRSGVR